MTLGAALTLTACGSDNATGAAGGTGSAGGSAAAASGLSGQLAGAGSSAQGSAQEAWMAGFGASNPDLQISYDPVGSGGGVTNFTGGGVLFAGTDSPLSEEQTAAATARCFDGDVVEVPNYISPIAVVYKIDGVSDLQLSPEVLASIFKGDIKNWNDPKIAADNPSKPLPDLAIVPVHRSDESGTTKNFTDYLNKAAASVWTTEGDNAFPIQGGQSGKGTQGMIQTVSGGNGTIGYADESQVGQTSVAKIKVGDAYVEPSAEAAAKVVEVSPRAEGLGASQIVIKLDRTTTEAGAYPIVLVSYLATCATFDNQADADNVKGYLGYVLSTEGQEAAAAAAGSAPLSAALSADVAAVVEKISVKG
ncbi:phosphate ABC transporter substrate-binding protein PstS [Micrococcales bacterium 31B]|nr:phosphate ABC transporter substrate-binding protein PstS [Micrococcales bacterium 31B]